MMLLQQANPVQEESKMVDVRTNPKLIQSKVSKKESNPQFLSGLAELLGQFDPTELDAHRRGLLVLLNDALEDMGATYGPFADNTPTVVIQRLAGELAA